MPGKHAQRPGRRVPAGLASHSWAAERAGIVLMLEELRQTLHARLDSLAPLARRAAEASGSRGDTKLRKRVKEIEARCAALQGEASRVQQEHESTLEQIEHDRRLLAEAWERLEQETARYAQRRTEPRRTAARTALAPELVPASLPTDPDDPVAQDMLKQFQSLQRDVRAGPQSG